jgi:hypothetical protein
MRQPRALLAALFFISVASALAQPANDNFASAFVLTGINVTTNGTTALATKEVGEPNHAGNAGGKSVWYRWTAPQSGSVNLALTATYRDLLAVYTGTAVDGLSPVASAGSGFGTGNVGLSFTAVAGITYAIAIDVRNNGAGGPFTLALQMSTVAFPFGSVWKYKDDGSDQGTAWQTNTFNDSSWLSGPGQLGYGDGDESTVVGFGPDLNNKFVTTYFRRAFTFANPGSVTALIARYVRDDGVIVYLNGVEAFRNNMPAGPVDYLTFTANAGDDGQTIFSSSIPINLLRAGTNIIAAEIHQDAGTSTDISFDLELSTVGGGNSAPTVTISNPTNNQYYFAPASISMLATASDSDGSVTNVEFFADGVKLGQKATVPYGFVWNSPPPGAHTIKITATDDQGASTSAQVAIVVYDAVGTPQVQITSPANATSYPAPSDIPVSAIANVPSGVTNVEFYANSGGAGLGSKIGQTLVAPYAISWNGVQAGNYGLRALVYGSSGERGTSAVVNVTVTNTPAPTVVSRNPAPGSVETLTSVQVGFSKAVTGVNASDFLVNGVAATGFTANSSSNYTFSFPQPAFGTVNITWAPGHGIQDLAGQPFNAAGTGATWSYNVADLTAPTIVFKTPAANSVITNLTSINVVFSESVQGVNASDLLINGSPAGGLVVNSASDYTFNFARPSLGTVDISWSASHGITDTSPSFNSFNAVGAGATWSYTLTVQPTILIPSNTVWRFVPGTNDASSPIQAWRDMAFNDSSWSNSATPFYYGDPYTNTTTGVGTFLSDMQNNYQCVYLRYPFTIISPASVSNFVYRHQSDDGFVAWINGVEVLRFNMAGAPTDPPYLLPTGVGTAQEPNGNGGAGYISITNELALASLVPGTNILAIQAFNQSLGGSSDFGFNMQFEATIVDVDPTNLPPRITSVSPTPGDVFTLNSLTVRFSERVQNVNAADLLINGVPATGVVSGGGSNYTFSFSQPAYGAVNVTWAANHGIVDFDTPPKPFDATAPGATFGYTLINASAPTIASQNPLSGTTVANLTSVTVVFSESVANVNASDLLVNGAPATGMSGSGSTYTFTFPQPAYGNVAISWAANHGITDTEPAQNAFDPTRPGGTWQYTLIDRTPPVIIVKNPAAGANVTNLQQLTVTFSENVQGVNASDLLVNGVPALNYGGSGSNYTFVFTRPNTSVVNIDWAFNHGITDLASPPNPFDATGPGATWQYFTPDNVAPAVAIINPPPGATIRNLTQLSVTFDEPVTGVNASDLLLNGVPAQNVSGSAAGPYTFGFTQPATGAVAIAWAPAHGITDIASPPNSFAGTGWSYVLDPNAVFADKIVINEIMYLPGSKTTNDEWIELRNLDTAPINLNGWRFSKGINYTFGNVTIPAGGYIVVVANTAAFQAKYPGLNNFVGPWIGNLANNGEKVRLETALGETVNEVDYATEGDWASRARGLSQGGFRGWIWSNPADGFGPSLELVNPSMPNTSGQNWRASAATNGTPGTANSVARTNTAPLILELAHTPAVPRSSDPIVISAKILDERSNGLAVTLFYRNASTVTPPAFSALQMFDDGGHNDGVANDTVWAATIPPQADKTVIEFYVRAVDADNNTNYWPAVAYAAADQGGAVLTPETSANAVFQVDDTVYTFPQPQYRLIMVEQERRDRYASTGNAEFNGTFITIDGTGTEVRYNTSFRERGAGSRGVEPANQRVNIPTDRRWKGQRELNLNTQFTDNQYAGYLLSRKSGLDCEYSRVVRVYINGTNNANAGAPQYGCYTHNEAPDSEMVTEHWPLDDGGNLYRLSSGSHQATLAAHQPPTAANYASLGYLKVSNSAENDYTDLTNLTYVLNVVPDSIYEASVRSNVNVENWMLYFAVNTILVNMETCIAIGNGDDAGLYHAPIENKWYFYAHDWDTILGSGGGSTSAGLFRMNALPSMSRFMTWSNFTPIYYNVLRRLCETTLSPAEVARTLDEGLGAFAPTANIQAMKQFATNRVAYVLSQLPPSTNTPIAGSALGGTIASNTILAASRSPYQITSTMTIPSGVTVSIEPGTTLQIANGANIVVANGGRILAEGTAGQPILFTRAVGGTAWGNITINGAVGSPETRITHANFEFNANNTGTPAIQVTAGTVFLDYLTFANRAAPFIHVDGASFVIAHCEFPVPTASFEGVHGTGGIKAGGRGIFLRNFFGRLSGYNDTVDFTGGNRPGPIVQFLDNVMMGSDDDLLDLDGTDAWVEGNIFLHAHRNGSPDSSSAVSGGNDSGQTSEVTVLNNIFYDVDQAATAKQLNFYTFVNNTVVHQSGAGFNDAGLTAVLNFADDGIAQARGMYAEGNIIYDAERLTRNVTNGTAVANATTFNGNLMPFTWAGPGASNINSAPVFKHVPTLAETTGFTNWASAQVMRDWFTLQSGSPGQGNGPNGGDKGAFGSFGVTVVVHPGATGNDAILLVGVNRIGSSIPATGFPNGSGFTHYKWRLDGGPWSAETAIATPINIPGFNSGHHRVDVSGKRDSGMYQDDPDYLELAVATSVYSQPAQNVRLSEILASNQSALDHEGTHPDAVELYNPNATAVDIAGFRLTDDITNPDKFTFPAGTRIPAGGYLVVFANNPDGTTGLHVGFQLSKGGQTLALYDSVDNGGTLLDSVTFGLQATDYSIGRLGSLQTASSWVLCAPTFGGPNLPAATGNPNALLINEILTAELTAFPDDFVEIYNPQALPVAMAGLFFTDNPPHWPDRSPVPALTFIEGNGYIAFRADGNTDSGADHLAFSLEAERGLVALLNTDYSVIDCLIYGPQTTDISQGRSPLNDNQNNLFTTPTPGAPNPGIISTNTGVVINEVLAANSTIRELDGSTPDWIELFNLSPSSVDLGDYSLSDESSVARKYVFAPGTLIPANGYLRLRCDGSLPASSTNTGFNIKAEGGALYLFDRLANGGALLNSVIYGLQAADFSISRVPNGTGNWTLTIPTPGGSSIPAATASAALVKVNEWMAAPSSGEDWFELWNPNPQPVAIGGYFTTDDLNSRTKSPIPALSYLGASTNGYQRFWADSNPAAGANHANFKLSNTGESIGLANPAGTLIDSITFGSQSLGVSEGRFPDGTATIVKFPGTESPGEANYLLITNVVINEALTHTDPPFEDAIELRNIGTAPVNIQNWWLSDAKGNLRKFRITNNITIPAGGFAVFYEYQFNNDPTNNLNAFSLSSAKGDEVYLSMGDASGNLTGYRTSVDFGPARNGVSFGRYVTSDNHEQFVAMSARSFGQDDPGTVAQFRLGTGLANPYPLVGPIVIAQIMYHPPDNGTNDNTLDEFVELRNSTGVAAPLFDPIYPTNTWRLRDAVDFDFPQGVSIPAGGRVLVVSFDPALNPLQLAAFRSKYGVDGSLPIFGPYSGKLANSDDKVELYRPDNPDAGFVPYVLADRVHYFDVAPWTTFADGTGGALLRVSLTGFGNDPTNWVAALPNFGGAADADGDGMPDAWETQYGLNPNNPADANADNDGDGLTNLQEYLAGTSPIDPNSALRILKVEQLGANNARLTFLAVSNKAYTVQFKNALTDASWGRLADVPAAPTNRLMLIDSVVPGATRFYRLVTPTAP